MTKMTTIQKKVEEALESITGIKPASPAPFFYTRLEARLQREESNNWERMSQFISRPAFAFSTVLIVLMLNIFVAFIETSSSTDQQEISEVATADDLGTNSFYDIENVQP